MSAKQNLKQVEAALEAAHKLTCEELYETPCTIENCTFQAALDALSVRCPRCEGKGRVCSRHRDLPAFHGTMPETTCKGFAEPCDLCDGTGRVMMSKAVGMLIQFYGGDDPGHDLDKIISAFREEKAND